MYVHMIWMYACKRMCLFMYVYMYVPKFACAYVCLLVGMYVCDVSYPNINLTLFHVRYVRWMYLHTTTNTHNNYRTYLVTINHLSKSLSQSLSLPSLILSLFLSILISSVCWSPKQLTTGTALGCPAFGLELRTPLRSPRRYPP